MQDDYGPMRNCTSFALVLPGLLRSSPNKQILANAQSRFTHRRATPRAAPITSIDSPPKYRSSTAGACREVRGIVAQSNEPQRLSWPHLVSPKQLKSPRQSTLSPLRYSRLGMRSALETSRRDRELLPRLHASRCRSDQTRRIDCQNYPPLP
jgi:hypothetical protein